MTVRLTGGTAMDVFAQWGKGRPLSDLAQRVEAEGAARPRDLDGVRARVSKQQALERELTHGRQHVAKRDAELWQLRQRLADREAQSPPSADAQRPPARLTACRPA